MNTKQIFKCVEIKTRLNPYQQKLSELKIFAGLTLQYFIQGDAVLGIFSINPFRKKRFYSIPKRF